MNINKIIAVCAAALVAAGSFAEDAKKLHRMLDITPIAIVAFAKIKSVIGFIFNLACFELLNQCCHFSIAMAILGQYIHYRRSLREPPTIEDRRFWHRDWLCANMEAIFLHIFQHLLHNTCALLCEKLLI
jgi:Co/Zn/Cd efflux system component